MRKGLVVEKPTTPMNGSMEGFYETTKVVSQRYPVYHSTIPKVDPKCLLIEDRGWVENLSQDFMCRRTHEEKGGHT
jgi:hypothetical protein